MHDLEMVVGMQFRALAALPQSPQAHAGVRLKVSPLLICVARILLLFSGSRYVESPHLSTTITTTMWCMYMHDLEVVVMGGRSSTLRKLFATASGSCSLACVHAWCSV
jgi:hypothetical protein